MRRIMLIVVAVLVEAMVLAALALPAFAQDGADVGPATCSQPPGVERASGQGVITPSGNINIQCRALEPGSNKGGSGGGGAEVLSDEDATPPPLELVTGGEDIFFGPVGDTEDAEAHLVETPSGNTIIQGHFHPNGN